MPGAIFVTFLPASQPALTASWIAVSIHKLNKKKYDIIIFRVSVVKRSQEFEGEIKPSTLRSSKKSRNIYIYTISIKIDILEDLLDWMEYKRNIKKKHLFQNQNWMFVLCLSYWDVNLHKWAKRHDFLVMEETLRNNISNTNRFYHDIIK